MGCVSAALLDKDTGQVIAVPTLVEGGEADPGVRRNLIACVGADVQHFASAQLASRLLRLRCNRLSDDSDGFENHFLVLEDGRLRPLATIPDATDRRARQRKR